MSNPPANRPPGDSDDESGGDDKGKPNNPFAGTPFEQIFAAFAGGGAPGGFGTGAPGASGAGMPDLSALMGQMQAMMAPHEGSVNWTLAKDVARRTVAEQPDPTPTQAQRRAVADAIGLADHWLDSATEFPSGVQNTLAWSRAEWVEETVEVWRRLVEPVAEHVVSAMGSALPEQAQAMAGPLMGILNYAGGAMFGTQVGQALGGLATEVLSASDIGLPLGGKGHAALLPANVTAFAEGLDVGEDDVLLYLALREAAHQRLFNHVPWLRGHLLGAVEDYGRGTTIDVSRIEESVREIDPNNPESLQQALEGGLFEPEKTPAQQAALSRLETALALVEGWVDEVVGQATAERMPAAGKLQEAVRRRRAAGGPAEATFASLVGLELRPRRLRDASALWGSLRSRRGQAERDSVWSHPDLLPTAEDLDDPLGFREHASAGDGSGAGLAGGGDEASDSFDRALADLLEEESGRSDRPDKGSDETDGPEGSDGPESSGGSGSPG
ncbi:MAG TPA: zinc-dependent metalloprotease [Nocardioidaceae bacterium]|nr:zinc-dependent metalloprotease [Nocardioidaceae bacterium]